MSNFRVMLKVKIKIVELWFVMTVSLSPDDNNNSSKKINFRNKSVIISPKTK